MERLCKFILIFCIKNVCSQDGKDVKVGKPTIEGATVEFEVGVTQKGEKVQVLKFKRKNRYARLKGFRPLQTVLTVKKINA